MATGHQITSQKRVGLLNAFYVYLLLFTSGSVVYMQASNQFLVVVFVVVFGSWLLFSERKINNGFSLYIVAFTSFLLLVHLYTDKSLPLGSVIGTTLELLLAYLILKIVGKNFVDAYIKVVTFLAVISIVGYVIDSFHLFSGLVSHFPKVGDHKYEGIFYAFRPWGPGRNASIFYEPGAYQMFLNTALFMLFFAQNSIHGAKRWACVGILVIALLTTLSTTGALIFGLLFFLFLTKSSQISAGSKIVLVVALSGIVTMFAAQFRYVIFEKIESYTAIEDVTDSENRRSFDLLVDLEIFKRHPLGIGYNEYSQLFSSVGLVSESTSSSNGISSTFAIYGFPFSIFLFLSYFAFFQKYFTGFWMKVIPFGMFLIFLFSEGYYTLTPYSLALIAAIFAFDGVGEKVNIPDQYH